MLNKSEVKYIQSLSQKKFRDEAGLYLVEGPKIVAEALASPLVRVDRVYALQDWPALDTTASGAPSLEIIAAPDLQRISQLKTPNQVLALVAKPDPQAFVFNADALCLALDGIQDPGNLGTIIRIADWFGIHQIICSHDTADAYNPKVVQSSMGSIFRVQLLYADLRDWIDAHRELMFYGAALAGMPLRSFPRLHKGVLVIGNESKGIRHDILDRINQKITIEKIGDAESLNAAVATGIMLSHLK